MPALITGSAVRTCLGHTSATFEALVRGRCGAGPLRYHDPARVGVGYGYEIAGRDRPSQLPASGWLVECVADAVAQAGVDPARERVVAVVGTGLRELSAVEQCAIGAGVKGDWTAERLHFAGAVTTAVPGIRAVLTLANACSAGAHALALAQDMVESGDADAVVVGGTDAMTASMLAMIGRVSEVPASRVRPFDAERPGVLLGDGAAALVLRAEHAARSRGRALGRLLATGLSCDAFHETAPDSRGILAAMRDALNRADREPSNVDLVVAHGTGTALNDPTEALALRELYADCQPGPLVTGIKGAVGHTSGGSALLSVAMALCCLRTGVVPAICGLRVPLPEAEGVRLVSSGPVRVAARTVQVNSFGFGGVNAVTLVEAVGRERRAPEPARPPTAMRVAVMAAALHLPGIDPGLLPVGLAAHPACDAEHAADLLGRKGLLAKEPATRLALCAVHRALGRPAKAPRPGGVPDPHTAVVVSSNLGNVGTVSEIARLLCSGGVRAVSPLDAPNASSNVIAGTVAIWFRFSGPNLTVCSGSTAGLDALWLAGVLLRSGRARRVVVVGAEPDDPDARRIHAMRAGARGGVALRAGAACLVLAPVAAANGGALAVLEFSGDGIPAGRRSGVEPAAATSPHRVDAAGVAARLGDTYAAAGVVCAALAVDRVAADPAARIRVVCGDLVDGFREIHVTAPARGAR